MVKIIKYYLLIAAITGLFALLLYRYIDPFIIAIVGGIIGAIVLKYKKL